MKKTTDERFLFKGCSDDCTKFLHDCQKQKSVPIVFRLHVGTYVSYTYLLTSTINSKLGD